MTVAGFGLASVADRNRRGWYAGRRWGSNACRISRVATKPIGRLGGSFQTATAAWSQRLAGSGVRQLDTLLDYLQLHSGQVKACISQFNASGTCDGLRVCQRGAVHAAPCTPAGGQQALAKAGCAAGLQLEKWLEDAGGDLQARRDGGRLDGLTLPPHPGCDGKLRGQVNGVIYILQHAQACQACAEGGGSRACEDACLSR